MKPGSSRDTQPGQNPWVLRRRGVRHGSLPRQSLPLPSPPADAGRRWTDARPIPLGGALRAALPQFRSEIARSRALFGRLRRGADFQAEVARRLRTDRGLSLAGASVDLGDPREIGKVFVRSRAGELWAKLSWIAHDERDESLRVRFSHGHERDNDWWRSPARMREGERFASALFPECALLAERSGLRELIASLAGQPVRFGERIVYANAPGGGAVFHHDAEPTQLGVLYGQLQGATAWLALPRAELAAELAACLRVSARAASRLLDDPPPRAYRWLNEAPSFTTRLVARGAAFVLRAGDAILLPSHGPERTCWHSVFALGGRPSLAHSYGIFGRRSATSRVATPAGGQADQGL